ncbi:hypothetical protein [Streptomyces sp. NBC_01423]|uniref:hypothetical protein n=1 Tax=Streptomyces sp. NBC_01423 TaxID=2903860 RepID=UPI002E28781B|nr:hypothetical protein [Streptomyces sp. NBC_01423]
MTLRVPGRPVEALRRRTKRPAGLASRSACLGGLGHPSSPRPSPDIFNYRYGDCLRENSETGLKGDRCTTGRGSLLWQWNGGLNTNTTRKNDFWGRCLYQQDDGYYRTAACDRNAQNQRFTIG